MLSMVTENPPVMPESPAVFLDDMNIAVEIEIDEINANASDEQHITDQCVGAVPIVDLNATLESIMPFPHANPRAASKKRKTAILTNDETLNQLKDDAEAVAKKKAIIAAKADAREQSGRGRGRDGTRTLAVAYARTQLQYGIQTDTIWR